MKIIKKFFDYIEAYWLTILVYCLLTALANIAVQSVTPDSFDSVFNYVYYAVAATILFLVAVAVVVSIIEAIRKAKVNRSK